MVERVYVVNRVPPFLQGKSIEYGQLVVPVRDPHSRMAIAGREGSHTVQERRALRERRRRSHESVVGDSTSYDSDEQILQIDSAVDSIDNSAKTFPEIHKHAAAHQADLDRQISALPARKVASQLIQLVRENQVVVVVGETGSGKTTQLPQILADELACRVIITQPRRVAAVSVAKRVADERQVQLGEEVGYAIQFDNRSTPQTQIRFVTDGVLLRECVGDPMLDRYGVVIIDEAHERSLNTDVLLGLLKRVLAQRSDLRVIITSATLEAERFAALYGDAPHFTIHGRTFPVHINHLAIPTSDYVAACVRQAAALHVQQEGPGDILVFMTGREDIAATCEALHDTLKALQAGSSKTRRALILPLYSQLQPWEQARVFAATPANARKIVVATNIAETSLTVDGIRFVVDSGYVKLGVYQPRAGMDSLLTVPISRAAATQRSGRAGRTAEGWAYRMWTQREEVSEMLVENVPQIKRVNLTQVVLLLKSLGIEDVNEFAWLDAPDPAAVSASLYDLWALGAIDPVSGSITDIGHILSAFPMDPHMSRMVLSGVDHGCCVEMITILAMLSLRGLFLRPPERAEEADRAHDRFAVAGSDHLTLLNVWSQWNSHRQNPQWAARQFLDARILRQAGDFRDQLERHVKAVFGNRSSLVSCGPNIERVRRAICAAYFHQAARMRGVGTYLSLRTNVTASVHPTSVLSGGGTLPEYVVYDSLLVTTQQYIVTVTAVEAGWLLEDGAVFYSNSPNSPTPTPTPTPDLSTDPPVTQLPKPTFKRKQLSALAARKRVFRGV